MANAEKQQGNRKRVIGRPFKKGQSGNPKGRPKKEVCIPHILRQILNETINEKEQTTKLEAILRCVVEKACGGESWAIQYLSDRTEGKAVQRTDVELTYIQDVDAELLKEVSRLAGIEEEDAVRLLAETTE